MANPQIIEVYKNTPTKVATNITAGVIRPADHGGSYSWTYRMTGDTTAFNPNEWTDAFQNDEQAIIISVTAAIDVYVKAHGIDGRVKVEA